MSLLFRFVNLDMRYNLLYVHTSNKTEKEKVAKNKDYRWIGDGDFHSFLMNFMDSSFCELDSSLRLEI